MSYRPPAVYLTHFGQLTDVAAQAQQLRRQIDAHVDIARRAQGSAADKLARIRAGLVDLLLSETRLFGCRLSDAEILEVFAVDLDLNAQGLACWADCEK